MRSSCSKVFVDQYRVEKNIIKQNHYVFSYFISTISRDVNYDFISLSCDGGQKKGMVWVSNMSSAFQRNALPLSYADLPLLLLFVDQTGGWLAAALHSPPLFSFPVTHTSCLFQYLVRCRSLFQSIFLFCCIVKQFSRISSRASKVMSPTIESHGL